MEVRTAYLFTKSVFDRSGQKWSPISLGVQIILYRTVCFSRYASVVATISGNWVERRCRNDRIESC